MTNLTLYWLIPKDRSSRVRWLLRELNVEFSEQQMNASNGEHRSGDYLNINPFGKVPAIVTDNLTLSESGAILLYLLETLDTEHRFSPRRDTELWPIFLQWFLWGLTTFESAVFAFNGNQGDKERANHRRIIFSAIHSQLLTSPVDTILAFCPPTTISLVTLPFRRSCHEFLPGRRQRALPKRLGGRKSGDA